MSDCGFRYRDCYRKYMRGTSTILTPRLRCIATRQLLQRIASGGERGGAVAPGGQLATSRRDSWRIQQRRQRIGNGAAAKSSAPRFPRRRPVAPAAASCRTGRTTSAARPAARRPPALGRNCRCRRDARAPPCAATACSAARSRNGEPIGGSFGRQLMIVLREQNAAPAEPLARVDGRGEEMHAPRGWPSRRKRDRRRAGGEKLAHFVGQRRVARANPTAESRRRSCVRRPIGLRRAEPIGKQTEHQIGREQPLRKNPSHRRQAQARAATRSAAAQAAAARTACPTTRNCNRFSQRGTRGPSSAPFSRGESCTDHNTPGAKTTLATGAPQLLAGHATRQVHRMSAKHRLARHVVSQRNRSYSGRSMRRRRVRQHQLRPADRVPQIRVLRQPDVVVAGAERHNSRPAPVTTSSKYGLVTIFTRCPRRRAPRPARPSDGRRHSCRAR